MTFKKIRKVFSGGEDLNKRIFWVVGIVTFLFSIFCSVTTIFENIGIYADIATIVCCVLLFFILVISYKSEAYDIMYMVYCLVIVIILMPLNYFWCGGIHSGMPIYFTSSIVLCVLSPDRHKRRLLLAIGYISFISCFILGKCFPSLVTYISEESAFVDIILSFLFSSFGLCMIIKILTSEYETATKRSSELVEQLENRTKRDMLTGLNNRNALFEYFYSTQFKNDNDLYIALFDIDNFRSINDNFGNTFGDKVLKRLGAIINENVKTMIGEMGARYGSEEFVYVISAEDYPAAVRKADNIRTEFASTDWEDKPGLRITLSGGIAKCDNTLDNSAEHALKVADEYLYIAKAEGKNRIKRAGSGIVINNIMFRT